MRGIFEEFSCRRAKLDNRDKSKRSQKKTLLNLFRLEILPCASLLFTLKVLLEVTTENHLLWHKNFLADDEKSFLFFWVLLFLNLAFLFLFWGCQRLTFCFLRTVCEILQVLRAKLRNSGKMQVQRLYLIDLLKLVWTGVKTKKFCRVRGLKNGRAFFFRDRGRWQFVKKQT